MKLIPYLAYAVIAIIVIAMRLTWEMTNIDNYGNGFVPDDFLGRSILAGIFWPLYLLSLVVSWLSGNKG